MKQFEVNCFYKFYERQLKTLKLQGKAQKTIDAYAQSIRRTRVFRARFLDGLNREGIPVPHEII